MIFFFPTVAGAITSVLIQNQLLIFNINRPFFYQIRHQSSERIFVRRPRNYSGNILSVVDIKKITIYRFLSTYRFYYKNEFNISENWKYFEL